MSAFVHLSRNPHKQLMWLWVCRLMKESRSYHRGLDLACGELKTFKYFQTKEYLGVDADESRVTFARQKFGVPVIVSRLEELPDKLSGDFVVCLQTIGFNRYFDISHAVEVVRRCVQATSPMGMILINATRLSQQQFAESEAIMRNNFETVEIRQYGLSKTSMPKALSLLVACFGLIWPDIAKKSDSPAWLFICRTRKG